MDPFSAARKSLLGKMPKGRNRQKGARWAVDGFSNLVDECRRSVAQES